MKISELSIKNVRAVPDLRRKLGDGSKRPFDVVLVTGPMASGNRCPPRNLTHNPQRSIDR